jgi:hypothetical protein
LFIFSGINALLHGRDIKFIEKIELSPSPQPNVWDFCVTDDHLIIVPDFEAGNIKIYEKNGNSYQLVKKIGRKGYESKDGLSGPSFCFFNKEESKFGVTDFGIRKIFIYDRIGRVDFKRVKEIACWRGAYDIQLKGDKLLISGYTENSDGQSYDFYYYDLLTDQTKFLLPSYYKYSQKSYLDYEVNYRKKPNIPAIGIMAWFDTDKDNDNIYFVWEGNLKIMKFNSESGEIVQNPDTFGEQTSNYVKPNPREELFEARRKRDHKKIRNERGKWAYVRNIFTSSKYVFVLYEGSIKQYRSTNFWLQFYKHDGEYIEEIPIKAPPGSKSEMWMQEEEHVLYFLSSESREDREYYFVSKYKILN